MKCPSCKETLVIIELNNVEVDYCTNCKGIWLDSGELELLMEDENKRSELFQSLIVINNLKEKKLKCPVCNETMEKVKHKDISAVNDKCIHNHGIWFDKDELIQIIEYSSISGENNFTILIRELFEN